MMENFKADPHQSGVSLLELLLVVLMIGVLAVVFFANLSDSKTAANEAAAISSLKTVIDAERHCMNLQPADKKGYCSLDRLVEHRLLDQSYAESSTAKKGYHFAIKTHGDQNQFFDCVAIPSEPGKSGSRAFAVNEKGIIFASDKGNYIAPAINSSTRAISGGSPIN